MKKRRRRWRAEISACGLGNTATESLWGQALRSKPTMRKYLTRLLAGFECLDLRREAGAQESKVAANREKTEAALGHCQRPLGIDAIKSGDLSRFLRRGDNLLERGFDLGGMRVPGFALRQGDRQIRGPD